MKFSPAAASPASLGFGPMKPGSAIVQWALLCAFFAGCAPPATVSVPRPAQGIYHIVRPGENLFRIGKAYDVSYQELARVNGIKHPDQIRAGQRLLIPGATRALPVEVITPVDSAPDTAPPPEPGSSAQELLWPVNGRINSGFGPRGSSFHDGVDIGAPQGAPIHAVEKGEVIYSDQLRGYGNIVIVRHAGNIVSVYAHNQINLVHQGQSVERGDILGRVGSTGRVTGPHLHFEIRRNNTAQDPLRYLPQLCCLPASAIVGAKGTE